MAVGCVRGGLDYILGKTSLLNVLGLARTGLIFTRIQEGAQPGGLTQPQPGQTEPGIPYYVPSCRVQRLEQSMSYSPPVRASVSAIRGKRFSAQEREYRGYTPRGTLWFYLRDHREDMRKWDGKPSSSLEARVCELRGKTINKGDSVRKNAAPVSSSQLSRPGVDSLILIPILWRGPPSHFYSK